MSISLKGYKNLEKISEGIKITIYRGERIRDRQAVTIALLPDRDRSPIELKFDDHRLMFPSDSIFGGPIGQLQTETTENLKQWQQKLLR
ncbi:hypothetical protein [Myxosarcina sp. GI1(2024)]